MPNDKYDIQELLQRDVYVNDKKVGTIVGERHHPNEARVRSMRIQVEQASLTNSCGSPQN